MKLRNKNTGEIIDLESITLFKNEPTWISKAFTSYNTISELNSEWEDYTPKEPLIKDEKIRKTLKNWAEINSITMVSYDPAWNAFRQHDFTICFDYDFDLKSNLEDEGIYTIAELCGEEE